MRAHLFALLAASLLAVPLAGCGGAPPPKEVKVTLTDFAVASSLTTFTTGTPYRFVVTNKGATTHELRIAPPMMGALPAAPAVPQQMRLALPMAAAHGGELLVIATIAPGATASGTYTFRVAAPAGHYELGCHIAGHYEAGMKLPIAVKK